MRLALIMVFFLGTTSVLAGDYGGASPPRIWLPIVATRTNIGEAFTSAVKLSDKGGELHLVETKDCRNLKRGFYVVVAGIHDTRRTAESVIAEWRTFGVSDAYLRSCEVVAPSRLSLGVPLLDPTFMQQPIDAVNWGMEDAVSQIVPLNEHLVALIIPCYEAHPEDIREGLRIGVRLHDMDENRSIDLSADCIDPKFAVNASQVAVTCVNETAAAHLLHRTHLYALPDGKVMAEKDRCTMPAFKQGRWICQKESVDANGVLEMTPTVLYQGQPKP